MAYLTTKENLYRTQIKTSRALLNIGAKQKWISPVKTFYLQKKVQSWLLRTEFLLSAGQPELEWADTRDPVL